MKKLEKEVKIIKDAAKRLTVLKDGTVGRP